MKRQLNLSFVILIAITMLLSACGAETETSTTAINIPAVSIGQATESNETYPVGGAEQTYPAGSVASETPNTYPVGGIGQLSDAEIEELLKKSLMGIIPSSGCYPLIKPTKNGRNCFPIIMESPLPLRKKIRLFNI